ncbi:hypothetical protein BP5796_08578 [Coleophoma crateriformis]|uniref:NAD(P)-binding protein n=1 Tax=Coleophoma crateriformis TaxID=565419 RepID=A0A3D8R8C7_9HELO|nr:hypothetical protein BP5796_08578 [Coleophoma crateriformis]
MASTTYSAFGAKSTATEVASAFGAEIEGKAVLITGVGPKGLGEALALAIAAHNPRLLVLASRTIAKLQLVEDKIRFIAPKALVQKIQVDLSSQKSVRYAATEIIQILREKDFKLDVLINNAGINVSTRQLSPEGIELQFATNHVGPFLLTNLVLQHLSPVGRVVNVSSEGHRASGVRFSDWNFEPGKVVAEAEKPNERLREMGFLKGGDGYEVWLAYGQSKTANILFAVALNERFGKGTEMGRRAFACHPGNIWTEFVRDMDQEALKKLETSIADNWKTADQGAATMLVAAFDPKLQHQNVTYMDDCQPRRPARWAGDAAKAEQLWELSESLVGERFGLGQRQGRL